MPVDKQVLIRYKVHDSVLIDTLIAKGVDVSVIYDGIDISFARKIKLSDDKTKIIFA